jgi:hypothetical protein
LHPDTGSRPTIVSPTIVRRALSLTALSLGRACAGSAPSAAHDGHAATPPSQQPNKKKDETAERFKIQPILLLVFEHFQSVFTVETVTNWKARASTSWFYR